MRRAPLLLLSLLAACADVDGDGFRGRDCDDAAAAVNPDAVEACDGIDNDCDGFVDEGVALVAFWDRDGDGFGDPALARRVCALPADGVLDGTDCDDTDERVHPGAAERCDGADDDCDGLVDEEALRTFYTDADGDGHGDPDGPTTTACEPPAGYAPAADDCDDADPAAWTDRPEQCDGADNDCDGLVDEDLPSRPVWLDADGDGSGDPASPALGCGERPGQADAPDDCDDADPTVGAGATERPGTGADEDCDGFVDEIAVPDHVPDLPAALAAARDGDVVQLGPGTFFHTVDLTGRDLTLAGEGCAHTALYADGGGAVLTMDRGRVTGLTLAGGVAEAGGGLRVLGDVRADALCVEGNAASGEGGGIAVLAGHLELDGARVARNQAGGVGGGLAVASGASARVRASVLASNVGFDGGNAAVGAGSLAMDGVALADGRATGEGVVSGRGGGIYAEGQRSAEADLDLSHVTVHANRALQGQAIYARFADVIAKNALFSGHAEERTVLYERDASITVQGAGFVGNAGRDERLGYLVEAVRERPDLLAADPGAPGWTWDLRPAPGSRVVDAGVGLDPDGTPADLGAWGGAHPPSEPVGRIDQDADADGLPDGWEIKWGLRRWDDDAALDPDGDGLDHLGEWLHRADPSVADTDGDGVSDGDEVAAGADPADPSDHAPFPDAGPDRWVLVGAPLTLDGSGTLDPNGDPLALTWAVTPPPGGAPPDLPDAALATFTPAVAGTWRAALTAVDAGAARTDEAVIVALDAVVVPDEAPTLAAALALAGPGGAVALRPGTWAGAAIGGDAVVFGLGAAEEVVIDGGGAGPVLAADGGGALTLAHLTVRGGASPTDGGCVRVRGGALTLRDVRIDGCAARDDGGAVYVQGALDAEDSVLSGSRATRGGGAYVVGELRVVRGALLDNAASTDGGALALSATTAGANRVASATFQGNTARAGAAAHLVGTGSALWLDNVAIVDNAARDGIVRAQVGSVAVRDPWLAHNGEGAVLTRGLFGRIDLVWGRHHDNDGGLVLSGADPNARARGVLAGDALVARWTDDAMADDVLVARRGSPLVDAGAPDRVDVDGGPVDLGPGGGPDAPRWRQRYLVDVDGDGLSDGWERDAGLDPTLDDAAEDPDGDGLTNAEEHALGTAPDRADTDGDGVPDGAERDAGADPVDPSDHRPVARILAPDTAVVGAPVPLDGSLSSDPNGDPLSFAWTVLAAPAGSALGGAALDPVPTPIFTPDARGAWRLRLVVSDAAASSPPAEVELAVAGPVRIPETWPDLDAALPHLLEGDTVRFGPGTHRVALDRPGLALTLEGAGAGITVLRPRDATPIVSLDADPALVLRDLSVEGGVGVTGGGVDCRDTPLRLEGVVLRGNVAAQGGALHLRGCPTVLRDVWVRDSASAASGGGVYAYESDLDWVGGGLSGNVAMGNGAGIYASRGALRLRNLVLADNLTGAPGGGVYVTAGTVDLAHLTLTGNLSNRAAAFLNTSDGRVQHAIFAENEGVGLQVGGTSAIASRYNGFDANTLGPAIPAELAGGPGHVLAPPRFAAPGDWHLRDDSPMRDAGDPTEADPDGTRPDLGAYGGALAPAGFDAWYGDADEDGLPDGWEREHGLDPADPEDADDDPDADGLDARAERAAGTDPRRADTDGDGLPDGSDPAPTDGTARRPVAIAGEDRVVAVGQAAGLDGGASTDPDGAIAGFAWAIEAAPGRSRAALIDALSVRPTFVPDTPGRYVISLVVHDGALSSAPNRVVIDVPGDLVVPDDYAALAEAVALASDGAAVHVGPGEWALGADLAGRDLELVGAGRALTVIVGAERPILTARAGERLALSGLTLRGGSGDLGGAISALGTPDRRAELVLRDVGIEGARAVDGGAVAVVDGSLEAEDVALTGGRAARYGGAIYLLRAVADLRRALFADDVAHGWHGGAIYARDSDLTVTNAILAGCSALSGGGIHLDGTGSTGRSTLALRYASATDNAARTGGALLEVSRGDAIVEALLVAGSEGPAIGVGDGSTFAISFSSFGPHPAGRVAGADDPVGSDGNRDEDPGFAAWTSNGAWTDEDWRLAPGSPSVDSADPAALDADGSPADRGAYGGPGG